MAGSHERIESRIKELVEDFEQTAIAFMRKHGITHDEYRAVTDIIVKSIKAGEESLLFDIFFEAESTDIANQRREGSPEAIEGPFYLPGAPELAKPHVLPTRPQEAGETLLFLGQVCDMQGNPLADAELDVWQADAEGLYSNIHPGIPAWNLRGRIRTEKNGAFELRTIVPPPYEIPKHGPTGKVLSLLGRHYFRPAHLHVKVRHPSIGEMTSQIYFDGGEYLDSDVANAVRDGLIGKLERHPGGYDVAGKPVGSHYRLRYDFTLAPARADTGRVSNG